MADENLNSELIGLTTDVVAAYVSNNPVSATDLPALISEVHKSMTILAQDGPLDRPRQEPAVPINKSITKNHIICLEDGAKLKMLKRYLRNRYNLTPEEYRERWGLPSNYPMVAPEYAERRSKFAKKIGLGKAK